MRFYNVETELKNNPYDVEDLKTAQRMELDRKICKTTMGFSEETYYDTGLIFVVSKTPFTLSMGIKDDKTDAKKFACTLLDRLGFDFSELTVKEVSMETFFSDLTSANRSRLIEDDWAFSASLGIDSFFNQGRMRSSGYSDRIVDENKTFAELKKETAENFLGVQYTAELNRILKRKTQKQFIGHPAHYIIVSKNSNHRRLMIRNLIAALYKKGRIIVCLIRRKIIKHTVKNLFILFLCIS